MAVLLFTLGDYTCTMEHYILRAVYSTAVRRGRNSYSVRGFYVPKISLPRATNIPHRAENAGIIRPLERQGLTDETWLHTDKKAWEGVEGRGDEQLVRCVHVRIAILVMFLCSHVRAATHGR